MLVYQTETFKIFFNLLLYQSLLSKSLSIVGKWLQNFLFHRRMECDVLRNFADLNILRFRFQGNERYSKFPLYRLTCICRESLENVTGYQARLWQRRLFCHCLFQFCHILSGCDKVPDKELHFDLNRSEKELWLLSCSHKFH